LKDEETFSSFKLGKMKKHFKVLNLTWKDEETFLSFKLGNMKKHIKVLNLFKIFVLAFSTDKICPGRYR
jgi:hypothetical protein